MRHINSFEEFLEKAKSPVCCKFQEREDTHFARLYLRLTAYDPFRNPLQYQAGGLQNFVSDKDGRSVNLAKAEDWWNKLKVYLEGGSIQIEEAPLLYFND